MENVLKLTRSQRQFLELLNPTDLPSYVQLLDFTYRKCMTADGEPMQPEEMKHFYYISELRKQLIAVRHNQMSLVMLFPYLEATGIERICAAIEYSLDFVVFYTDSLGAENRKNLYFLKLFGQKIKALA